MKGQTYEQYDRYEVISAWIKEMRLGNVENATYWLTVMEDAGESPDYIGRRLVIFATEDCIDPETLVYAKIASDAYVQTKDTNISWSAVWVLCKARKWWELKEGREREEIWAKVEQDRKNGVKKEIPSYALDLHTKRGKAMHRSGQVVDDRFSGTEAGRKKTMANYLRNGKLDVDDMTDLF